MAQQQSNLTSATSPSGSVTNSSSPGQGGGGQDSQGIDDSQIPATGSSRTVQSTHVSPTEQDGVVNSNIDNMRRGQGSQGNFQGEEEMGIYMAIPSSEIPGKYVEFDNLGPDAAHELTGMYKKAHTALVNAFGIPVNEQTSSTQNQGALFNKETSKTAEFGHSGTPGKSLAPDSEDKRKTSPIRGGKGEGVNQQARNQND